MSPITVSELNRYIKNIIQSDLLLSKIKVQGEVTNYKHHKSGHMYFTLKDEESKISAVSFKWDNKKNVDIFDTGDNVIVTGLVDFYERDGSVQLYAKKVEKTGYGLLHKQFEDLKIKLRQEGLFDEAKKKAIPPFPKVIGIVTADTGAAIHDMMTIAMRRNPGVQILLYPSLVQGDKAPEQIMDGIKYLDQLEEVEVIIIGRGGGSFEELNAFNDERLARVIFACQTPIISAVGHETDFSISDFVADLRAPTPSAAAELAVCSVEEVLMGLNQKSNYIQLIMKQQLVMLQSEYEKKVNRLQNNSPVEKIKYYQDQVKESKGKLERLINHKLLYAKEGLMKRKYELLRLNPQEPLDRGFAYVLNGKHKRITTIQAAQEEISLYIKMQDGVAAIELKEEE